MTKNLSTFIDVPLESFIGFFIGEAMWVCLALLEPSLAQIIQPNPEWTSFDLKSIVNFLNMTLGLPLGFLGLILGLTNKHGIKL